MSDPARIIELETRLAFQEHALAELNDIVTAQGMDLIELRRQLDHALGDMKLLRGMLDADPGSEPPPPHF